MSTRARPSVGAVAATVPLLGAAWAVYLTVVGRAASRSLRSEEPDGSASAPTTRFRILVPAHDESGSIGETVDSLLALDYPSDHVDVHVVADNCTDDTAALARAHGAVVHERDDPDHPGKGPALAWLIDRLEVGGTDDAVVIVDADSVVRPDALVAFDRALRSSPVVQGYYTVRDAASGGHVGFRAVALAVRHLVRPAGRTALGGSSSLYGNGMAFRDDVARSHRWSDHLTEDLELGLRLLLDGTLVGFTPDAVIAAEMPASLEGAATQNERWEAGRSSVARRFVPRLLRAAISRRHGRRWAYVDAAIDISMPPLTTLATVTGAGTVGCAVLGGRWSRTGAMAGAAGLGLLARHVLLALDLAAMPPEVRRSLILTPTHAIWKSRLVVRIARRRPDAWVRTARRTEAA